MSAVEMNATEMAALLAQQGERIAKLEAQLASRTAAAPTRIAPRDEQVRIFAPPEPRHPMPTEAELGRLLELVTSQYSVLRLDPRSGWRREEEERDHVLGFNAAFRWLGQIGRTDQLDRKHAMSFWADQA